MKHKIQYIIIFMTLINLPEVIAQGKETESGNNRIGWQDEISASPIDELQLKTPPEIDVLAANKNEWWKLFGYEQLNKLIALALKENYSLKIAQSQVGTSREEIKVAKASQFPTLSLSPSFSRQEFSGNRPIPFEGPVERIRYNTYSLPLDVAYEVDVFGRMKNDIEASKFNYEATAASKKASELRISSEAASYFILLMVLDSEIEVLENTRKSREENLRIVKIRFEAGLTNEIDLHRAQSELSSIVVQMKNLEIERRDVELALATISGQPSGSFSIEKTPLTYAVPSIKIDNTSLSVLSRPNLIAANYAVAASKKRIASARKNLYPSLYLAGSTGLVAGESDQIFEGDSRSWLVGATLAIPIFEGGRRQALLNISEYQLEQSVSYLSQEELISDQQVLQELSAMKRLGQQLEAQQEFLLAAQRAAYLSQQRYIKGLVTYLEVVDAERIVLEAERLSIQLIGKQLLNSVELLVALGGDLTAIEVIEDN